MEQGVLSVKSNDKGMYFDPRTKILLVLTVSIFILGGMGNGQLLKYCKDLLIIMPLILLIFIKEYKKAFTYISIMLVCMLCNTYIVMRLGGTVKYIVVACINIYLKFVPQIMLAYFFMATTTVSEFTGAMKKMHISDKIIIPLSVMFRFIPTVIEEASAINSCMKMRKLKYKGIINYIEYNLIPLITCVVNIGQELSAAALSRGLGGKKTRTNICRIGFKTQDIVLIIFCIFMYSLFLLEEFKAI